MPVYTLGDQAEASFSINEYFTGCNREFEEIVFELKDATNLDLHQAFTWFEVSDNDFSIDFMIPELITGTWVVTVHPKVLA